MSIKGRACASPVGAMLSELGAVFVFEIDLSQDTSTGRQIVSMRRVR